MQGYAPYEEAASVLPEQWRKAALEQPERIKTVGEEFRLRLGRTASITLPDGEWELLPGKRVEGNDLYSILEQASRYSVHTVFDRIGNGFVTMRGGHRVGLCGTAVMESGTCRTMRGLSSVCIRIAREVPGVSLKVLPSLFRDGELQNTLILAPPGDGKTTFLRDLVCQLSNGFRGTACRVGIADERGEVAALWDGEPQMEVGNRADVMDGCPKGIGAMMLLRGMNPQVIAMDEITAAEDLYAAEQVFGCGVKLLATIHAGSTADLSKRPIYRRLTEEHLFSKAVVLFRMGEKRGFRVEDLP